MKSVNQVKRQESLKKWLEIIKNQRASGLSALAYCKREGIANTTFYYWQNQIQKLLIQQHEQQEKTKALPAVKPASKKPVSNAKKADVQFAPLPSASSTKDPSSLELRCGPVQLTISPSKLGHQIHPDWEWPLIEHSPDVHGQREDPRGAFCSHIQRWSTGII